MLKEIIKRNTTLGLRESIRNVRAEYRMLKMHRTGLLAARSKYKNKNGLKLNLGCGHTIKEGWVNIDFNEDADLMLDLREALPFASNSCSIIYSEHFFEHIEYPNETDLFLSESLRILDSSGVFSVGVPDTEWPLMSYKDNSSEYWKHAKEVFHPWCTTQLHHINFHFRQGKEHKYAYDFETLKEVLEKAGFVDVKKREFDKNLDSDVRKLGTLYVDAKKP